MRRQGQNGNGSGARTTGFTLVEIIVTLFVATMLLGFSVPKVASFIQKSRANRAAQAVAMDLELALSLAARRREPVRIIQTGSGREFRIVNRVDGSLLHERELGPQSEYRLATLSFTPAIVDVWPTGLSSAALTVDLTSGAGSWRVTMSRAGQVRVAAQ